MNELINDDGVCRTAPATPDLLNIKLYQIFRGFDNIATKCNTFDQNLMSNRPC